MNSLEFKRNFNRLSTPAATPEVKDIVRHQACHKNPDSGKRNRKNKKRG